MAKLALKIGNCYYILATSPSRTSKKDQDQTDKDQLALSAMDTIYEQAKDFVWDKDIKESAKNIYNIAKKYDSAKIKLAAIKHLKELAKLCTWDSTKSICLSYTEELT